MTSAEFQSNQTLTSLWRERLEGDEVIVTALGVLEQESPLNTDSVYPENETKGLVAYGRVRGYADCLRKLRELAEYRPPPTAIPRNYGAKIDA